MMEEELDQLIAWQQTKLLEVARRIIPHVTQEDIMQPFDFPELEESPLFRYEEGVWSGLLQAKTLLLQWSRAQD